MIPSFQELTQTLASLGWKLDPVKMPTHSRPSFVVSATGPDGKKKIERDGPTEEYALINLLSFAQRHQEIRAFASLKQKLGGWDTPWENQLEDIAGEYAKAPVFDPKAVPAWHALAAESKMQADAIRNQLNVKVTDDPEPYPHVGAMIHDIHHKGNFMVSRAHSDHPVWSEPDNINFRIVHDVLGHGQTGGDFGWHGENKACGIHFPMVSPLARRALFTECVGQTAYALRKGSHGFGPQKVATLDKFLDPVEKMNGEHVFVPHGKLLYPEGYEDGQNAHGWSQDPLTGEWKSDSQAQQQTGEQYHSKVFIKKADYDYDKTDPSTGGSMWDDSHSMFQGEDPNMNWSVPQDIMGSGRGVIPSGHPEDYLDRQGTVSNTAKMVVPWWERDDKGQWKYPVDKQEQIILNALRVCMLSPLKNLKYNAAHYQGIADMPASATGKEMWDRLDSIRRQHNKNQGFDPDEHLSYYPEIKVLSGFIQYETGMHKQEALKEAKNRVFAKVTEFEKQLTDMAAKGTLKLEAVPGEWKGDDMDSDHENPEISPLRIYLQAHQMVDAWVKGIVQARSPQPHSERPEQLTMAKTDWHTSTQLDLSGQPAPSKEKYAGFMGTHLDNIAKIAPYLPEIRQAALKDIYTDGGRGFIFRNAMMNMKREFGITGVNPKVISFVWLMLYPEGSDLGIVDTHVARAFGRKYEHVGTLKDYYKMERMEKTAKDVSGYPDMPLGTYHHGLWDMARTKDWTKGWQHSDHSPLAVDEPEPWDTHTWDEDTANAKQGYWTGPPGFEYARPHAEDVGARYDALYRDVPKAQVPPPRGDGFTAQARTEEWEENGDEELPQNNEFKMGDRVMGAQGYGTVTSADGPWVSVKLDEGGEVVHPINDWHMIDPFVDVPDSAPQEWTSNAKSIDKALEEDMEAPEDWELYESES